MQTSSCMAKASERDRCNEARPQHAAFDSSGYEVCGRLRNSRAAPASKPNEPAAIQQLAR